MRAGAFFGVLLVMLAWERRAPRRTDIPRRGRWFVNGALVLVDTAIVRLLGRRLMPLPFTVTTSAEKYLRDGWLRRGGRNLGLLTRYLGGADPETLAKKY